MNKCPKCGTEFEGKFCPNCGTKWEEEKICPSCGTKLSGATRFCSECGYSFVAESEVQVEENKKQEYVQNNTIVSIYGILRYLPALLFALFSVLLFIFYIAPVAVLPAQEFMGEKIPSESYGNVYSMYSGILSEIPELKGAMLTLILLAVFSLIFAIVNVLVNYLPTTQNKEIKLFGKVQIKIGVLLNVISFIVYLIFFIIGCVVCGKISAIDDGMELLSSGACPILLIVFSLIFALFGTGAFAVRYILRNKTPALAQIEVDKAQAQAEAERQRKEQFYATHTAPVAPAVTGNQKLNKKQGCIYKHQCRRYKKAKEGEPSRALIWFDLHKVGLSICVIVLAVIIAIICILIPIITNNFKTSKVEKIELGFTQEQVRDVLGDPYEETKTDYCWQYFDDDYSKVLDKLAVNSKKQEKALTSGNESKLFKLLEEEEQLETQLNSMTYKYIEINFSQVLNEDKSYAVSSVYFEPNKRDSNSTTSKNIENVILSTQNSVGYYVDNAGAEEQKILIDYEGNGELYYSAYYSDGAFYRDYLVDNITDINGENGTLEWSDKFASYEVVNKAIEIGTVNVNGVWTTTYKDVKALILPESVTRIGSYAFEDCSSLTSIVIPNGVTSIGSYAFYDCRSLTKVYYEGTIVDWCNIDINGSVFSSDSNAIHFYFRNSNDEWEEVTSIEIPNTLTEIRDYQFCGFRNVTSIIIPESVTSIGSSAFNGCYRLVEIYNLSSIDILVGSEDNGYVGYYAKVIHTSLEEESNLILKDDYVFIKNNENKYYLVGYNGLETDLVLPNDIEGNTYEFNQYAFNNCRSLENITIPNSVTSVGDRAFYNCINLTSITIPNSVTIIGEGAFDGCRDLANVYYEGTIEDWCNINFNSSVFYYANSNHFYLKNKKNKWKEISSIDVPNTITQIGDYQFYGFNVTSITIPNSVTSIGEYAFYSCSSLTSAVIPNSVTSIDSAAFDNCDNLQYHEYDNGYYLGNEENPYLVFMMFESKDKSACEIHSNTKIIYSGAFDWCNFASITIPNSVTSIGDIAFANCSSLTSVTIGNSVTSIGDSSFANCSSLTSITIPNSVTSIGENAFYECSSLTSITIGNSVTSIGENAFSECSSLTNVYYEGTIEDWCSISFSNYSSNPMCYASHFDLRNSNNEWEEVTKIEIPNTVTQIGAYQFYGFNNVTSITIPESVTIIGEGAFNECSSLTGIAIQNSVTSIGSSAFKDCSSLTSITIGNSVTSIGNNAFEECSSLTNVYFEGTLEDWCNITFDFDFDQGYFNCCSNPMYYANHFYLKNSNNEWQEVTSIEIPNTITKIGAYQFYGFNNVTSITIPKSVISIGYKAFDGCSNLTNVYYDGTIEDWCNITFENWASNPMSDAKHFYLKNSNNEWEEVTNIEIPNTIRKIGAYQFYGFNNVTSITIPKSVTNIGENAFSDCSSLTSITIPNSVTSIGKYAFSDCSSLTSITIPNSVTSIGEYAFYSCSSLTSITIPNSVTSIGERAFEYCSSLTSIVIPNSVTSISEYAFYSCSSLTSIVIPNSVTIIENWAFYGCGRLTSITIPNSVTSIGEYAFSDCSSLTSIVIPNSVTAIAYSAFINCSSLKEVYYKGTTNQWSNIEIDSYNSKLTSATIYYYSETQPTESGNYWHYVYGVVTKW